MKNLGLLLTLLFTASLAQASGAIVVQNIIYKDWRIYDLETDEIIWKINKGWAPHVCYTGEVAEAIEVLRILAKNDNIPQTRVIEKKIYQDQMTIKLNEITKTIKVEVGAYSPGGAEYSQFSRRVQKCTSKQEKRALEDEAQWRQ